MYVIMLTLGLRFLTFFVGKNTYGFTFDTLSTAYDGYLLGTLLPFTILWLITLISPIISKKIGSSLLPLIYVATITPVAVSSRYGLYAEMVGFINCKASKPEFDPILPA